jgi:hypothetical protein
MKKETKKRMENIFEKLSEILRPKYIIQSKETGDFIDVFTTYDEAKKRLLEFEKSDRDEGIFVQDFYEIKIA